MNQVPKVISEKFGPQLQTRDLNYNPRSLGEVKNYLSLAPKSQRCLKPIFELSHEDGVFGTHEDNVAQAYTQFQNVCHNILDKSD